MRTAAEVERVSKLRGIGLSDHDIASITGIPLATIRHWRRQNRRAIDVRPAFDVSQIPARPYAYLLGIYLGDGSLTQYARDVYRLMVALDSRYPLIIQEVSDAMETIFPEKKAHREMHRSHALVRVDMYSRHWPTVFPQHGPGRKHERRIVLIDWQAAIVEQHHEEFLRGLVHSDGCRFINRVWVRGKSYEYPRYNFTNASADIRGLFCASCDALGIAWRRMNARNISVARREAVARMDEFIGPKR